MYKLVKSLVARKPDTQKAWSEVAKCFVHSPMCSHIALVAAAEVGRPGRGAAFIRGRVRWGQLEVAKESNNV